MQWQKHLSRNLRSELALAAELLSWLYNNGARPEAGEGDPYYDDMQGSDETATTDLVTLVGALDSRGPMGATRRRQPAVAVSGMDRPVPHPIAQAVELLDMVRRALWAALPPTAPHELAIQLHRPVPAAAHWGSVQTAALETLDLVSRARLAPYPLSVKALQVAILLVRDAASLAQVAVQLHVLRAELEVGGTAHTAGRRGALQRTARRAATTRPRPGASDDHRAADSDSGSDKITNASSGKPADAPTDTDTDTDSETNDDDDDDKVNGVRETDVVHGRRSTRAEAQRQRPPRGPLRAGTRLAGRSVPARPPERGHPVVRGGRRPRPTVVVAPPPQPETMPPSDSEGEDETGLVVVVLDGPRTGPRSLRNVPARARARADAHATQRAASHSPTIIPATPPPDTPPSVLGKRAAPPSPEATSPSSKQAAARAPSSSPTVPPLPSVVVPTLTQCAACRGETGTSAMVAVCALCDQRWHLDCLHPPRRAPPRGTWLCTSCVRTGLGWVGGASPTCA
jgi:hypothetical protein